MYGNILQMIYRALVPHQLNFVANKDDQTV